MSSIRDPKKAPPKEFTTPSSVRVEPKTPGGSPNSPGSVRKKMKMKEDEDLQVYKNTFQLTYKDLQVMNSPRCVPRNGTRNDQLRRASWTYDGEQGQGEGHPNSPPRAPLEKSQCGSPQASTR